MKHKLVAIKNQMTLLNCSFHYFAVISFNLIGNTVVDAIDMHNFEDNPNY